MQTNLASWIRDSPQGIEADSILRKCVHCGFCLATCPTYNLLGEKTAEYASAPDTLHGPIMGVDYSGKVHKWIIGHSSGSTRTGSPAFLVRTMAHSGGVMMRTFSPAAAALYRPTATPHSRAVRSLLPIA